MKINTQDSLRFKLDFSSGTQISNIFEFETTIASAQTVRLDAGESFIYFSIDLKGTEYAKLDDLVSRSVINIPSRLDETDELTSTGCTLVNQV
jgi:hypothetical protein